MKAEESKKGKYRSKKEAKRSSLSPGDQSYHRGKRLLDNLVVAILIKDTEVFEPLNEANDLPLFFLKSLDLVLLVTDRLFLTVGAVLILRHFGEVVIHIPQSFVAYF